MKIYNADKTQLLNANEIDYNLGKLVADKLATHIEGKPEIAGKSVEEVVAELQEQGVEVEQSDYDGKWYKTVAEYENGGKDVEEVKAIETIPAQDAYDEYEDIQVWVPYTEEELYEHKLKELRMRRETECFPIINRGGLWYDTLTLNQIEELSEWYQKWLNVTETLTVPKKPEWLK